MSSPPRVPPRVPAPLAIALEITPPAAPRPAILLRRASLLGDLPQVINVIQRRERWSSLGASIALREAGAEPVWHLANRGRRVAEIEADLARAADARLRRVLCIRGEHKAADGVDTPLIREVVRLVARAIPAARISVTLNHYVGAERTLRNLLPKLEAGATGVQTQVVFDLDTLNPVAEEILARHPDVAIAPMLMPVLSADAALRAARRLSIELPAALRRDLDRAGETAGWAHFRRLVGEIDRSPLYSGIAVMTPIDAGRRLAARLRAELGG